MLKMKIFFISVFLILNVSACQTVSNKIDEKVSEEEMIDMIENKVSKLPEEYGTRIMRKIKKIWNIIICKCSKDYIDFK